MQRLLVGLGILIALTGPNVGGREAAPALRLHDAVPGTASEEPSLSVNNPAFTAHFKADGVDFKPNNGAPAWRWNPEGAGRAVPVRASVGKIVYHRNGYQEEYLLEENFIEQQFVIAQPVDGDIVIGGSIESNGIFSASENGWHWSNERGDVTLGHVYAFDATGQPLRVSMEVTRDSTLITMRQEDIAGAVYPLTIDPKISTSFRITSQGVPGSASYLAKNPDVAYDPVNKNYVVVWEGNESGDAEIYAQRVDSLGAVLGTPVRVSDMTGAPSNANFDAREPRIAYHPTRQEFFVVWAGDDTSDDDAEIYGARLAASNLAVLQGEIKISTTGDPGTFTLTAGAPDVAYDGDDGYLVVWNGSPVTPGKFEIFGQLMDGDGTEDGGDFQISDMGPPTDTDYGGWAPKVTLNPAGEFMVVWMGIDNILPLAAGEYEIFCQRLTLTGTPIAANDQRLTFMGTNGSSFYGAFDPDIVFNSTESEYLLVWSGDDNTSPLVNDESEIFGQLLDAGAGPVGSRFRISDMGTTDGNAVFDALYPAVSWNPDLNQYLVTWHGDDVTDEAMEIFSQVLTATGAEVGTDTRLSQAGITDSDATLDAEFAVATYNTRRREHLVVWHMDDDNAPYVNNEFEVYGILYAEPDAEPVAPPTGASPSVVTSSSFTMTFAAAADVPDGYLVLRKTGSSPTDVPLDQTSYSVGAAIGGSTVVHVGSTLTFNQSGLSPNTTYFYDFFSYNGANSSTNYREGQPLETSVTTLAAEPTTQASGIVIKGVSTTSITLNFTKGNGTSRLIVGRKDFAVNDFPDDGNSYTANGNFSLAQDLGSGNRVVGLRTGADNSDVVVTNLSVGSLYYFRVFEFNGSGALTNYRAGTATGNPSSAYSLSTQPTAQPTGLMFTAVTSTAINGSFSAASGSPDGYIVVRRQGAAPTGKPVDGKVYSAGDSVGAAGTGTVVYAGGNTTFNSTGLSPAALYYYAIFAFNGSAGSVNYRVVDPLLGSAATLDTEPPDAPTGIAFGGITSSSMTISFEPPPAAPDGYLIVQKEGAPPSGKPVDGKLYVPGDTVGAGGDCSVVYAGANTAFEITGLPQSTLFYYLVFAYNGAGVTANYLTVSPPAGSQTTYAAEPPSQPTVLTLTNITTSSMDGAFEAVSGTTGYVVLRKAGSSPLENPVDGQALTVGGTLGTSAVISAGSATAFNSVDLEAGTEYYYDVFAFNGSGETINYLLASPLENDAITRPEAPEALDATQIGPSGFTARWNASVGATRYELDVSPDNFQSFVTGYQAREVATGLEEAVTGLAPLTSYKYRVRAFNASGLSANSLDKTVITTQQVEEFRIGTPAFNSVYAAGAIISVDVTGARGPVTVTMHSRKISGTDLTPYPAALKGGSTGTYEVTVADAMADELGLEFYFDASDETGTIEHASRYFMYRAIDAASNVSVPFARGFSGKTASYQMFSVPYVLDDKTIAGIFNELGAYDRTRWRLFRYDADSRKHLEYEAGLPNNIELGKGYWFNAATDLAEAIVVGSGTVEKANRYDPAAIALSQGWNQVGNPYPFSISWSAVVGANEKVGSLWFFSNGTYDKSDIFKPWTGAFVHADEAMTLAIPVTAKTNASGRTSRDDLPADLDAEEWFLPMVLRIAGLEQRSGVGMHPQASASKDRFDEITVPRFLDYAEMHTRHDEFFSPRFSTDVVPTTSEQVWTFDVNSNLDDERGELTWDHTSLTGNKSSLILIDLSGGKWVDMKTTGSYTFVHRGDRQFRIHYNREGEVRPGMTLLGEAYPNPFTTAVRIPLLVNEPGWRQVEVYDGFGRLIHRISADFSGTGIQEMVWDTTGDRGREWGSGMLYYRLVDHGGQKVKRLIKK